MHYILEVFYNMLDMGTSHYEALEEVYYQFGEDACRQVGL